MDKIDGSQGIGMDIINIVREKKPQSDEVIEPSIVSVSATSQSLSPKSDPVR